jgi:hypothetical protein
MTTLQIYLLFSVAVVMFLVGSRVWLWRKLGIGQRGAAYGTKYQTDAIDILERQTKALERIADALATRPSQHQ